MIFALLAMAMYLVIIFVLGWFVVSPVIEWIGQKIFALALRGHEYYAMVRAEQSGEIQDPSH